MIGFIGGIILVVFAVALFLCAFIVRGPDGIDYEFFANALDIIGIVSILASVVLFILGGTGVL